MRFALKPQVMMGAAAALGLAAALALPAAPAAAQDIKIGFSMAMTGGLGPNGKSALLAQKIWEEDINAKGGLLGRPVKLIYYDDQTNPSTVPGIYSKLLDVDKVDLIIGGYATNMLAPAMPLVMQRKKLFIGLLGLGVNTEFNYPNYFVMIPSGPDPKPSFTKGFFDVAMAQNPQADDRRDRRGRRRVRAQRRRRRARERQEGRPEDRLRQDLSAGHHRLRADRARDRGDQSRHRGDRAPIRRIRSASCARSTRSASSPKMIGGGMVGLQNTSIKAQLGPLLNGFTNYDFWLPVPKMSFPGVKDLMDKYQARAPAEGVDPLGYYMAPQAYAQMQVLEQAVTATKSLSDAKLADYIRNSTFKTVLGDIKFGKGGEWAESRVLQVQFRGIKGNDAAQFKAMDTQVVVSPPEYASGTVIYPFEKAQ